VPSVVEEVDVRSIEDADLLHGLAQVGRFGECLRAV